MVRSKEREEAPELVILGANHPDYEELGFTWAEVFAEFKEHGGIDRLVIMEQYRDYCSVPKFRHVRFKWSYSFVVLYRDQIRVIV